MKQLTQDRIKELERAELKLLALEAGGVDNWTFYGDAMTEYNEKLMKEEALDELLGELEETLFHGGYEPAGRGAGFCSTEEAREEALDLLKEFLKKYEQKKGGD